MKNKSYSLNILLVTISSKSRFQKILEVLIIELLRRL